MFPPPPLRVGLDRLGGRRLRLGRLFCRFVAVGEAGESTPMTYEDLPGPWVYDVVATLVDGKVIVTSLTIRQRDQGKPQSISPTRLRLAPIGTLLNRVRSAMFVPAHERVEHLLAQVRTHQPKVGRSHSDEHFRQVAWYDYYAAVTNQPARRVIAEHWQVSPATASRWRRAARRLGYLPEYELGSAQRDTSGQGQPAWVAMRQATEAVERHIFQKVLAEQILPALHSGSPQQDTWINEVAALLTRRPPFDDDTDVEFHMGLFFRILRRITEASHLDVRIRTAAAVLSGLAPLSEPV